MESIKLEGQLPIAIDCENSDTQKTTPDKNGNDDPDTQHEKTTFVNKREIEQLLNDIEFTPLPDQPISKSQQFTAENLEHRRKCIRKIFKYRELFPKELIDLDLENLGEKSLRELDILANDVQFLVETRRSSAQSRFDHYGGKNWTKYRI